MAYESVWKKLKPQREIPISEIKAGDIKKILPQSTKPINIPRDAGRKAKLPGKRISKTGKVYWETRANRSDQVGKRL